MFDHEWTGKKFLKDNYISIVYERESENVLHYIEDVIIIIILSLIMYHTSIRVSYKYGKETRWQVTVLISSVV